MKVSSVRAHPRSRGENGVEDSCLTALPGSSPLTRGKHTRCPSSGRPRRLIPAHAGKTCNRPPGRIPHEAHPRSRGENSTDGVSMSAVTGSSPLTRGKPEGTAHPRCHVGLIPAHAGKTSRMSVAAWSAQAHPRSRGENPNPGPQGAHGRGSSPLTRGKRRLRPRSPGQTWLIPAHAGKTLPDLRFYCADRSDLGNP